MQEVAVAEEHLSRARFIRLGAALGVGAASASVLAACGGGGGEQGGSGGGASQQATDRGATGGVEGATQASGETSGGTPQEEAQGNAIASEGEVVPGTAAEFTDPSGQPAVLVHLENGDFVAYSAVCTHAGCTVAFNNGQLACPCHGSIFDPANGAAVVSGPANRPLPEVPVEVRDGQVFTA
ncbi:MAG: (2Fe-2S)-binding protein [Actinobacteria bacterium]|nr:MAG: (2Fe-2S)-binding protein [Actinomycetota bacterium]